MADAGNYDGKDMGPVTEKSIPDKYGTLGVFFLILLIGATFSFAVGFGWGRQNERDRRAAAVLEKLEDDFKYDPLDEGDLVVHKLESDRKGVVIEHKAGSFKVRLVSKYVFMREDGSILSDTYPIEWKRYRPEE